MAGLLGKTKPRRLCRALPGFNKLLFFAAKHAAQFIFYIVKNIFGFIGSIFRKGLNFFTRFSGYNITYFIHDAFFVRKMGIDIFMQFGNGFGNNSFCMFVVDIFCQAARKLKRVQSAISHTVRTLEAIGADLVVMRHGKSGAPYLAARNTAAGIINGGDGTHAHPTQALLDLFTMRRHVGDVAGKKVVIVGDVLHSRVARSNLWTLLASGADVTLCGPATLLPRTLASQASELGRCTVTTNMDHAIAGADIVMALRMQKERQEKGLIPSLREYITGFQVNARRLALAKPGALVMHPGPMNEGIEISPEVAHGMASVIEEQVANGVAVRMAILYLMATARHA